MLAYKQFFSTKDCCLHDSADVSSEGSPLGEVAEVTIFFPTYAKKIAEFYANPAIFGLWLLALALAISANANANG